MCAVTEIWPHQNSFLKALILNVIAFRDVIFKR